MTVTILIKGKGGGDKIEGKQKSQSYENRSLILSFHGSNRGGRPRAQ
jgi:hypothetical protein